MDFSTKAEKTNMSPSQALLGYLYQFNNDKNNDLSLNGTNDSNQIKSHLQTLLSNTTLVLQCDLAQLANIMPNQSDNNANTPSNMMQNLRIIPLNTTNVSPAIGNLTDINNNNTSNNNNNNNSTKLRHLLNSDILTPINTANLMNSSDNLKNNNNNKRALESDIADEYKSISNKFDNCNNENINKKQKTDNDSSNSNTGGNNNNNRNDMEKN